MTDERVLAVPDERVVVVPAERTLAELLLERVIPAERLSEETERVAVADADVLDVLPDTLLRVAPSTPAERVAAVFRLP